MPFPSYQAVTSLNALAESAEQENNEGVVTGFISLGAQVAFEVCIC